MSHCRETVRDDGFAVEGQFDSSYVRHSSTTAWMSREFEMRRYLRFLVVVAGMAALPSIALAQASGQATEAAPTTAPDTAVSPPVATPTPAPAPAPAPKAASAPKKKGPPDSLKPGQYIWEKRAYDATNLRIIAVLDIQRIYVFDGDELVGLSTMSSGKKGHRTPTGVFPILQKNVDHKSNIYDNAPMPYMQRLTWDGIALHAGKIPGYPASHGCLRLPMAFAKALYSVTKMGQEVVVLADLSTPAPKPEPVPEPPKPPVTTPPVPPTETPSVPTPETPTV
jgi:lipoprotein-anchoring transpeptidase ErfK/SrfK